MYLSLDIETTALDINLAQILQLSAIWDTGIGPVEHQSHYTVYVNPRIITGEPTALWMNRHILQAFSEGNGILNDFLVVSPGDMFRGLSSFIGELVGDKKITIAGKNVGSFDVPIIEKLFREEHDDDGVTFFPKEWVDHRFLDVGSMYAFLDPKKPVPGLAAIKKHIGLDTPVAHDAYEDALDVCRIIRHYRQSKTY